MLSAQRGLAKDDRLLTVAQNAWPTPTKAPDSCAPARGDVRRWHLAWFAVTALGVLAWFASGLSPLMLSILTTMIMIIVAAWESISLKSGPVESQLEESPSEATSA